MRRMLPVINTLLFLLIAVFYGQAEARSLFWQNFIVDATLTKDGSLLIREEQTLVFTGKWNGGERTFSIRPGQTFSFMGIYRKTDDGSLVELERGNLKKVDRWNWASANTLRWRSRLPGDPAFSATPITYVLEYRIGKILTPEDSGFVINHDFAFPQRSGEIKNFKLTLQLADGWQHESFPLILTKQHIPPGKSFIVRTKLYHSNPEKVSAYKRPAVPFRPAAAAIDPAPAWLAFATTALLLIFTIFSSVAFYLHEKRHRRFVRGFAPSEIDEDWLQEHVFALKPETVGATWDNTTDGNEVAAVLARLVVEGKLESRLEQRVLPVLGWKLPGLNILHLSLKQPRTAFQGYERKLIDGFFIDGDTTDTKRIRQHYRKKRTSFIPAQKIRAPLKRRVDELTAAIKTKGQFTWLYIFGGCVLAFFLLLTQLFIHKPELPYTIGGGVFGIIACIVGGVNGYTYRCRSDKLITRSVLVHLFPVLAILVFAGLSLAGISTLLTLGLFTLYLLAIFISFNAARNRDSLKGVELRRNLTSARKYFAQQLERENPALKDEWFPYLLAFGLGRNVDQWTKRFGDALAYSSRGTPSSHISSSSGGSSFSGGGGSFGGAGASGAWAMAATSMGASSSSSGSSGGGGGSSGGGGGGGW